MATTEYDEPHRKRLGRLLAARRGELGYPTRPAMEKATGLNVRLIADVEKGYRGNFKDDTLGRIAHAYQVDYDAMIMVLNGADLDRLEPSRPAGPAPPPRAGLPDWMTPEQVNRFQPLADEIWERLVKLGEDATSAELFGEGTGEARLWDVLKTRGAYSLRDMVGMVADFRWRMASPGNSSSGIALPLAATLVCAPQRHLCVTPPHVHPRQMSRSVFFSPRDMTAA